MTTRARTKKRRESRETRSTMGKGGRRTVQGASELPHHAERSWQRRGVGCRGVVSMGRTETY
eukprot:8761292-Pyramimonas_sp.AAC.1